MTTKASAGTAAHDAALKALRTQTTITPDEAALVLGQSGPSIRAAIARGDINSYRLNRNIRVPSAPLRRMLGIDE
jgi:hypothetical protein